MLNFHCFHFLQKYKGKWTECWPRSFTRDLGFYFSLLTFKPNVLLFSELDTLLHTCPFNCDIVGLKKNTTFSVNQNSISRTIYNNM